VCVRRGLRLAAAGCGWLRLTGSSARPRVSAAAGSAADGLRGCRLCGRRSPRLPASALHSSQNARKVTSRRQAPGSHLGGARHAVGRRVPGARRRQLALGVARDELLRFPGGTGPCETDSPPDVVSWIQATCRLPGAVKSPIALGAAAGTPLPGTGSARHPPRHTPSRNTPRPSPRSRLRLRLRSRSRLRLRLRSRSRPSNCPRPEPHATISVWGPHPNQGASQVRCGLYDIATSAFSLPVSPSHLSARGCSRSRSAGSCIG
jgi:hypothetical protein